MVIVNMGFRRNFNSFYREANRVAHFKKALFVNFWANFE